MSEHHEELSFWQKYVWSTDHKMISKQYSRRHDEKCVGHVRSYIAPFCYSLLGKQIPFQKRNITYNSLMINELTNMERSSDERINPFF